MSAPVNTLATGTDSTTARIFVNLPVKNLDRSVVFFTALGFSFDPKVH